jgi:hypothetical protein
MGCVVELRYALFEKKDTRTGRGILGEDDEYLRAQFCSYDNAEGPNLVVAKMCLMIAVVEHLSLQRIHWRKCVGSCSGLLIDV